MSFKKATKAQSKLRMALIGPAGSGKTYSALSVGSALGGKIAVVDTERGSASKYADKFSFDVKELTTFSPQSFIDAIREAEGAGYEVLIIDSLSHAWMGKDGALEQVDKAATRSRSGNSFTAWREVTPLHNSMVDAILRANMHIIVTMRSKTEYVLEEDPKTGKKVPRKVGMAPVQRDGLEYEFDVVGDLTYDNKYVVSKTRCSVLSAAVIDKPGAEFAGILKNWLTDGAPAPKAEAAPIAEPTAKQPVPQSEPKETKTITGVISAVVVGKSDKGKRYGIKIVDIPHVFGTYSAPAASRAEEAKGKEVKLTYTTTENTKGTVYEMLSLEMIEK